MELYCNRPVSHDHHFQSAIDGLDALAINLLHYVMVAELVNKYLQVNEEYMRTLEILSKKIKFVEIDTMVKTSQALSDVQPELEKLRQKAVSKVYSC